MAKHASPSVHAPTLASPRWLVALSLCLGLAACGGGSSSPITPVPAPAPSPVPAPVIVEGNTTLVDGLAINNFTDNETIRYPLPLLYGLTLPGLAEVQLELHGSIYKAPVSDGLFKVALPMKPGANPVKITTGSSSHVFTLNYVPDDNPRKVRMMLAVPSDGDGRFIAEPGVDNSIPAAQKKLALQGLLMQSATAEMMFKAGLRRTTYGLVTDAQGNPTVDVLVLPKTRAELHAMSDQQMYSVIADTITANGRDPNLKYMVTMSFSSYVDRKVVGHAALGGGYLGIFGSLHLHTCPDRLDQLQAAFADIRGIDLAQFPDDSNSRMSYWANCSTGMGASLHELGHALDLPHTPTGIMSRGFDHFSRLYMAREPGLPVTLTRAQEGGAIWDPQSAAVLKTQPWLVH